MKKCIFIMILTSSRSALDDDEDSLREKERLLAKKKQVLEKVLDRLQELILLSSQQSGSGGESDGSNNYAGDYSSGVNDIALSTHSSSSWTGGNALDDLRAEASEKKIFSPHPWDNDGEGREDFQEWWDGAGEEERSQWWKKIFSNRH